MGLNDRQTLKRLTPVIFLIATLFLVLGIFLSIVNPANAQTGTTTPVATAMGTASSGGVPVTGTTSTTQLLSSDLTGWNVVDRSGTQVGTVNSLLLDMRTADVCAATTSTSGTSSTPMPSSTSSASSSTTGSAIASCQLAHGSTGATSGVVPYIVVDKSGMAASGSTAATAVATPMATSPAAGSTSGNLVPVPWSLARFDPQNHQVILNMDASAFSNAPSFSSGNIPDLFTGTTSTTMSTFWSNPANLRAPAVPVTGATSAATTAPTVMATTMPSETTAATTMATTEATTMATTEATTMATTEATTMATSAATTMPSATTAATEMATTAATAAATSTTAATVAATTAPSATTAVGGVTGTATVPATVGAPTTGAGTPTALVPVTGVDLSQAANAAAAQQRMILDVGIVVVGLGLLVLGLLFRSGKG